MVTSISSTKSLFEVVKENLFLNFHNSKFFLISQGDKFVHFLTEIKITIL